MRDKRNMSKTSVIQTNVKRSSLGSRSFQLTPKREKEMKKCEHDDYFDCVHNHHSILVQWEYFLIVDTVFCVQ